MVLHVPVATSQASAVQVLPSLQSATVVQQPPIAVKVHTEPLQLSAVQPLLSLQSAADVQQPLTSTCAHCPVAGLQLSVVHVSPSSQPGEPAQQVPSEVCVQALFVQASVVQAIASSQSAAVMQQPEREP